MKLILALLPLMTAPLSAATIKTTVETGYYSKYITPFGVTKYNDWNVQTLVSTTATFEKGSISLGVLNFSSPNGEWDIGDETDIIFSGTFKLNKDWELRGGYAYFLIPDYDTQRSNIGIFTKVGEWTFGSSVLNFHTDAPTGGRWLVNVSANRNFAVTDNVNITSSSILMYDFSNHVTDSGFLFRQQLGLEYKVSESFSIIPAVTLYVPLTIDDVRETDFVLSIGGRISF